MIVRAVRWYRDLARLGIHLPFFLVHDFGLLYAAPKEQLEIGPRPGLDHVAARGRGSAELLATRLPLRSRRGRAERGQPRAEHAAQR